MAFDKIFSSNKLNDHEKLFLTKNISKSNYDVYLGQYIDQSILTDLKILDVSEREYLKQYKNRCQYLDGTQIGVSFTNGSFKNEEGVKEVIFQIGRSFGIMLQILDDFADFNPQVKEYSDVKNGKVTYPIFLYSLTGYNSKNKIRHILQGDYVDSDLSELSLEFKKEDYLYKITDLMIDEFVKVYSNVQKLKQYQIKTDMFDFIFPHIFLSRRLAYFVNNKPKYYKYIKAQIKVKKI